MPELVLKNLYFAIENFQKHAHIIIQSQWNMYSVLHYYNKYSKNTRATLFLTVEIVIRMFQTHTISRNLVQQSSKASH